MEGWKSERELVCDVSCGCVVVVGVRLGGMMRRGDEWERKDKARPGGG